jgi:predicted PurR-regulated permease PerM
MNHENSRHKLLTFTAIIICLIAVVFILRTLNNIFVPLILAIFIAYLFAPVVEFLAKIKVPRIVTLFILLGVISVIGIFIAQILAKNIREFIVFWPTMESKLLSGIETFFNNYFRVEPRSLLDILQSTRVTEFLSNFFNLSMNVIGQALLTLLILIFIYLTYNNYPKLVRRAFSTQRAQYIFEIVKNINVQIMRYIMIKTLMSAGTGILTGVACALFGIKFAVLWGFLAFLFNYIPYIGSIAAVILPIVLSVLQFPGSYLPVFSALSLIIIQLTIGSYLDPEMMGNRFNLSPILIILSLFFWGYVWGLVGAFLAVPITAVIKIIAQNIEPLKPVAVLMSKKAE